MTKLVIDKEWIIDQIQSTKVAIDCAQSDEDYKLSCGKLSAFSDALSHSTPLEEPHIPNHSEFWCDVCKKRSKVKILDDDLLCEENHVFASFFPPKEPQGEEWKDPKIIKPDVSQLGDGNICWVKVKLEDGTIAKCAYGCSGAPGEGYGFFSSYKLVGWRELEAQPEKGEK